MSASENLFLQSFHAEKKNTVSNKKLKKKKKKQKDPKKTRTRIRRKFSNNYC